MKHFITPNLLFALAAGFLLGLAILVGVRFATLREPDHVHYHANFALYINGKRDEFTGPGFYEEVSVCSSDNKDDPKARAHLHDNVNHVVHVHDNAVTWSAFFANLGYTLGDDVIQTEKGLYVSGKDGKKLSFVLNGQPVQFIANKVIEDQDVLLISYGKSNQATLKKQFDSVETDADEYDANKDPATCSGPGNGPLTFGERLKQSLGLGATASE